MLHFNKARWTTLCGAAGATSLASSYEEILARYSEGHRAYHNALHINECLAEFDSARSNAQQPTAVQFAIWFHDIIYDPRSDNNEAQSAGFANDYLGPINAPLAQHVGELIITTKSHEPASVQDSPLLLDIDLSILGRNRERFREFENGIRSEYAWVPFEIYRSKRAEILRGFLNRKRIYLTNAFHDRYESTARHNLVQLIADLEKAL